MNDVHFKSQSNEWATPPELFNALDGEFSFTLDPASTHENAKCAKHYTAAEDGLAQSWDGETVFCNPPYGREIGKWVKKASEAKATVVMLLPSRTDTKYFHEYILWKTEIRFLRGRFRFVNKLLPSYREDGNFKVSPAPFPSMIVIFRGLYE
jgi:site-specific DNA-methyltransferase (adenine-specific)